jgi:hypothetical protein
MFAALLSMWTGYAAAAPSSHDFVKGVAKMPIVVSNRRITAPPAYLEPGDVVMVPLRAIAEALEYPVAWEKSDKTVRIGGLMSFRVGHNSYNYAQMPPVELEAAPKISKGHIYVPLNFFTKVAKLNNAYVFEGHIFIDNNEKMQ